MRIEILEGEVLDAVRQNLGVDADDDSRDEEIEQMEIDEIFERYLVWNGIIGFGSQIREALETILAANL